MLLTNMSPSTNKIIIDKETHQIVPKELKTILFKASTLLKIGEKLNQLEKLTDKESEVKKEQQLKTIKKIRKACATEIIKLYKEKKFGLTYLVEAHKIYASEKELNVFTIQEYIKKFPENIKEILSLINLNEFKTPKDKPTIDLIEKHFENLYGEKTTLIITKDIKSNEKYLTICINNEMAQQKLDKLDIKLTRLNTWAGDLNYPAINISKTHKKTA